MTDERPKLVPVVITIDGPAGTGKSTVAHRLARRLGLEFLDTGAMYRAAALVALERSIDPVDGPALAKAVEEAGVRFDWTCDPPALLVGGIAVGDRIRELDVSSIVSKVAAQPELRRVLVARQRRIASEHPRLVTEGRDQGSTVFPDAPVRFYLDADAEVRADRRITQLRDAGRDADRERVVADIRDRDRRDASRADGPLVRPAGGVVIDTSMLDVDAVVDELERVARYILPEAGFAP